MSDLGNQAMKNVDFKAELRNVAAARIQCEISGAHRLGRVLQTDTYFRMTEGRLKRREAPGEPVEWIYYHRADGVAPRLSNYAILTDDQAVRRWGTQSLQSWLTVRKSRELWMLENVRIHIDDVETLGRFIEFEAVVSPQHDVDACDQQIADLRRDFGPCLGEPIGVSYADLIEQTTADRP